MQSDADRLSNFLELVFKRLRNGNTFFILEDSDSAENVDGKFVSEFRKRVNLISVALQDIHCVDLHFFSDALFLCRLNIFTLITSHCFKICDESDSIFFAFMYTCSYVSFVLNYFERKGLAQLSKLICMCTLEIFEYRMKESFEDQGGWVGLENYTKSHNLHEFINYFCSCYTDGRKLFTPLKIRGKSYGYGDHKDSVCVSSSRTFAILQDVIIVSYQREFLENPQYLAQVLKSFMRARAALEQSIANIAKTNKGATSNPVQLKFSRVQITIKASDTSK